LEVEEIRWMERILNSIQVCRRNIDWDLIPEETEVSLPDQMRFWKQDEREKKNWEHGRPFGPSLLKDRGGAARRSEAGSLGMRVRLDGALGGYQSAVERRLSGGRGPLT
jgi:hypothetical protein